MNKSNLKLKIWKVCSIVVIFLLSFIVRNMYFWVPSFITSLLFPVSDSIWQFNKVIILSFLIWSVFEKVTIRKKHDINTCTSGFIAAIVCAFLFMLIYSPIYFYVFNSEHNLFLMFLIYFICIVISVLLNYQLLKRKYNSELEKKIILAWFAVVIINAILTYYHPDLALFFAFFNPIFFFLLL